MQNNVFYRFKSNIDTASEAWTNRMLRYSEKYQVAHGHFKEGLKQRELALKMQAELIMTVGILAGTAVLAFGPAAAALAAAGRLGAGAALGATNILRNAGILAKMGVSRGQAYRLIRTLAYGSKDWVVKLAKGPGQKALTAHLARDLNQTSPVNDGNKPADPLMHRTRLEKTLSDIRLELLGLHNVLVNLPESVAAPIIMELYKNSPYFQMAPAQATFTETFLNQRPGIRSRIPQDLEISMERDLWAGWLLSLEYETTVTSGGGMYSFTPPTTRKVKRYNRLTQPVVDAMDRVGIRIRDSRGRQQTVDDFIGWFSDQGERRTIVEWAKRHLRAEAARRLRNNEVITAM